MTAPATSIPSGPVIHLDRMPPAILALVLMLAAMLLPMAHMALHGTDRITANVIASYASRAPLSPNLVSAAQTAAENRIAIQPLIGPAHALLLMLVMAGGAWVLTRWRASRLSFGTAMRAAALAFLAGQLFYLVLYFADWALLGASAMLPEWQRVVPTSLAALHIGPRSMRPILEGITLGSVVRFTALGVALRRLEPTLRPGSEWIVAVGTALVTLAGFVLGSLL